MTPAQSLRQAAGILLAEADKLEGKTGSGTSMTTYNGRSVTVAEAWAFMLEEIANRAKPHEWRDWTGGNPSDSGDNSDTPETDDFMRAFRPMMDHAGMAHNGFKDSTGALFFAPNIRKRGGWPMLYKEALAMVLSPWGQAWMSDPLNSHLCPKPAAIAKLMGMVRPS